MTDSPKNDRTRDGLEHLFPALMIGFPLVLCENMPVSVAEGEAIPMQAIATDDHASRATPKTAAAPKTIT